MSSTTDLKKERKDSRTFIYTTVIALTVGLILLIGVVIATALALTYINSTDDNLDHVKHLCMNYTNNQGESPNNTICNDNNTCTYDVILNGIGVCEHRNLLNGVNCTNVCLQQNDTQTCNAGECTGTCIGTCEVDADCPPLPYNEEFLLFWELELGLNTSTIVNTTTCFYGSCLYRLVDLGYPGAAHTVQEAYAYPIPVLIGLPAQNQQQQCLQLYNNTNPLFGCLTSSYYYVGIISNATTIIGLNSTYGQNAFVCDVSFGCASPSF